MLDKFQSEINIFIQPETTYIFFISLFGWNFYPNELYEKCIILCEIIEKNCMFSINITTIIVYWCSPDLTTIMVYYFCSNRSKVKNQRIKNNRLFFLNRVVLKPFEENFGLISIMNH